jgi:hypothetical protein
VTLTEIPLLVKGKGRPSGDVCSTLAIRFVDPVTQKKYWRCIAWRNEGQQKCDFTYSGNPAEKRVLAHSVKCSKLSEEQKRWALDKNASSSLGAKVTAMEAKSTGTVIADPSRAAAESMSLPVNPKTTFVHDFTKVGQAQRSEKINHNILKLICVRGLVPNILDSQEWKEFITFLAATGPSRHYVPTSSTTFLRDLIPAEAAYVRKEVLKRLENERNLTLTFDGTNTRKAQSVYTTHVTTKARRSYWMDSHENSLESHTAEWVKDILLKV